MQQSLTFATEGDLFPDDIVRYRFKNPAPYEIEDEFDLVRSGGKFGVFRHVVTGIESVYPLDDLVKI